jgi:endonuclease/exonuclease/phosphatase family metal-dependent hydrolase
MRISRTQEASSYRRSQGPTLLGYSCRRWTRLLAVCLLLHGGVVNAGEAVELRILSFNIWYGGEQVSLDQVVKVIRTVDADIVALQEPDGNTLRIARAAGYPYVDTRRHLLSRWPLFDSGSGERTETGLQPYSVTGLDANALHAWALIAPGRVIAVGNTHLSSERYGPDLLREGRSVAEVMAAENEKRVPEVEPLARGFGRLAAAGVPLLLAGDFNSASHLDWTAAAGQATQPPRGAFEWPVTKQLADAGLIDSYRSAHPDPVTKPGYTFTPGYPHPLVRAEEIPGRIDYVFVANARVVKSEIVGESGNPAVDIPVMPWPSDHRAVVSTISVVPMTAPPLIVVEPRPVMEGEPFLIRANMPGRADWTGVVTPRGGDPLRDRLTGIAGVGFWERPTIKLSTLGLPPGRYDAVLLDQQDRELARTRFTILGRDAKPSLAVEKPVILPGDSIAVTWRNAPGLRFDWIGIYRRGETNIYNYLGYVTTGALHDGQLSIGNEALPEPLPPGDYELRLLQDDSYVVLADARFTVATP